MVEADVQGKEIDFPGKDRGEELQFYFRQHWIRVWRPFRNLVLWTVGIVLAAFLVNRAFGTADAVASRRAILLVLCFLFIFAQLTFLIALYKYFLYIVVVTDKKIHRIKKTLLTVDEHQSIDLWMLEDITKNQHGIIQNLFGFGTLVLVMQSQDALRIHFTPFIGRKHEKIMRLREHARRQMSPQHTADRIAADRPQSL